MSHKKRRLESKKGSDIDIKEGNINQDSDEMTTSSNSTIPSKPEANIQAEFHVDDDPNEGQNMGLSTGKGNCLPETERELVRIPGPLAQVEATYLPDPTFAVDGWTSETPVEGDQLLTEDLVGRSSSPVPSRQTRPAQVKEDDEWKTEPAQPHGEDEQRSQLHDPSIEPGGQGEPKTNTLQQGKIGQEGDSDDDIEIESANVSSAHEHKLAILESDAHLQFLQETCLTKTLQAAFDKEAKVAGKKAIGSPLDPEHL